MNVRVSPGRATEQRGVASPYFGSHTDDGEVEDGCSTAGAVYGMLWRGVGGPTRP